MEKDTNYKLLFAGILAFFVIMTFNQDKFLAGNLTELVKVILGIPAVGYLIWYNVKKNKKSPSQ